VKDICWHTAANRAAVAPTRREGGTVHDLVAAVLDAPTCPTALDGAPDLIATIIVAIATIIMRCK